MKNKICALIRQTWYETAKKNLQPGERLRFYEMCLEYEFFDNIPDEDAPFAARLLFDMVRNDIDQDKSKAAARADRARTNGAKGGRPLMQEKVTNINNEQQNPEKPSGISENPYIHNNKQNTTLQNIDSVQGDEDAHLFFNVCLLFFEKGCSDPCGEGNTFWHYYEAMGWKTKGGGEVVDRLALAKAWRLSDCSRVAMRNRAPYADLMHKANPVEIELLQDFVSMTRNATTESVEITFEERRTAILLDSKYMPALQQWIPRRQDGTPYTLKYQALHQTID